MLEPKVKTPKEILGDMLDGVQIQFQEKMESYSDDDQCEVFEHMVKCLTQIDLLYPLLEALDPMILEKLVEEIANV